MIVPAGALAGIPWGVLPDLRGRPVTVCPSASSWLAAWRRGQAAAPAGGPPLLVAGPDLEHAAREVTEIAACYPGCRPLLGEAATVGATLRGPGRRAAGPPGRARAPRAGELPVLPARPGRRPADGLRHPAAHGRSPARGPVLLRRRADRRPARRGDPRLHRGPALHRHRDGDLQRHPGGRRGRRRHDDRLPPPARGRAPGPPRRSPRPRRREQFSPFVCFGGG